VTGHTGGDLNGQTGTANVDAYISQYDHLGSHLQTVLHGGAGNTSASTMAIDAQDNIYIAGTAEGDLAGETLTGTTDAFLSKFNSLGEWQWTRLLGAAASSAQINKVTLDEDGFVYVTGTTSGQLGATVQVGNIDMFVAKFNSLGTQLLLTQMGIAGNNDVIPDGIIVDSNLNTYVAGRTTAAFHTGTMTGTGLNAFLTKFNANLSAQSTTQIGGTANAALYVSDLLLDSSGNLIMSGHTAGAGTIQGQTITGVVDAFLIELDTSGTHQWTALYGEASEHSGSVNAAIDSDGNLYIVGETYGALDANTFGGSGDAFVTKFTAIGQKTWTRQIGGAGADTYGMDVTVDASGNVFISGETAVGLAGNSLTGTSDAFIAQYNSEGVIQ